MTHARHILFPQEVEPASPVGGKARALAQLTSWDLPVPEWFVVLPSAFEASMPEPMRANLDAAHARRQVLEMSLADDIAAEVDAALARLATQDASYAVRSSALDEDSAKLSFAGQLESAVGVARRDVGSKIVEIWASGFSERLMRYRRKAGLDASAGAPAVIVQRMIAGEASGVAFSADPVSGRRAVSVVAAVPGLCSALVSGDTPADTWRVDRSGSIIERAVESKRVTHRYDPAAPGGVRTVPLAAERESAPTLADEQVRQVVRLARQVEARFGRPQDIEWTIDCGRLHLLQARPITTLADQPDPDGRGALWDNANIIESYSGVTTPLTFSFARRAYEHVYREFCRLARVPPQTIEAHDDMFRCMLGFVRGRVYYNLYNWYRLVGVLPGYRLNRRFMEQMMGVRQSLPDDMVEARVSAGAGAKLHDALRAAHSFVALALAILTLRRRMERFFQRLRDTLGSERPDLSGLRSDELVSYYRRLESRLLTRWDAPIVNDFATMLFHGLLRRLATAWVGERQATLSNDLLCAERDMVSEDPAVRVRKMARLAMADAVLQEQLASGNLQAMRAAVRRCPDFERELQAYLDKFGDRCIDELKLESPALHEDPTPLLRAIGQTARHLARRDARDQAPAELAVREQADARVRLALRGKPLRRLAFAWVLRHTRQSVRWRENLRFERTRVFGRARQILLELGSRFAAIECIDAPRDVFYLELDEVLGFVEGRVTTVDLKGLVALRKSEYARWRDLPAPADRFETRGIIYKGHTFGAGRAAIQPSGDSLKGLGCCPGVVRGPVRVVREPRNAEVQPGEIIVAERTDPGWVMVFPSASGLLVERGSLLSHSAIVARELGLPTIVSLPGVMAWLEDGDWVEMDGASGVVSKVARSVEASTDAHS
jgi:phosphohistidine swiveling domain-containing protein